MGSWGSLGLGWMEGARALSQPRPAVQGGIFWLRALKSCRLQNKIGLSPAWVVVELVAMLFLGEVMSLKALHSHAGNLQRYKLGMVVISSCLCMGDKLAWECGFAEL